MKDADLKALTGLCAKCGTCRTVCTLYPERKAEIEKCRYDYGLQLVRKGYVVAAPCLLPFGRRLLEDGLDFRIVHLRKMGVELTHRAEECWRMQAHHLVGIRPDFLQRIGRRHRHRADQLCRFLRPERMQCRNHGRAGGQSVVDDDDDASRGVMRRAYRGILAAAPPYRFQLCGGFILDVCLVRAGCGSIIRQVNPAALIDRTDGELRIARRAQFAHQHHIHFTLQPGGDDRRHRHRPARYRQYQRLSAAVLGQSFGQLLGCCNAICKYHDSLLW